MTIKFKNNNNKGNKQTQEITRKINHTRTVGI